MVGYPCQELFLKKFDFFLKGLQTAGVEVILNSAEKVHQALKRLGRGGLPPATKVTAARESNRVTLEPISKPNLKPKLGS